MQKLSKCKHFGPLKLLNVHIVFRRFLENPKWLHVMKLIPMLKLYIMNYINHTTTNVIMSASG